MSRPSARRNIENSIRRLGFSRVAGVDEVGRGCLAGPVVAAAVILEPGSRISGIRDSKLLTPMARERLYDQIVLCTETWSLGVVGPEEIDRLNIHKASLKAMRKAVVGLVPLPDFALVDGFSIPDLLIPQRGLLKADRRCTVVAAASILAKVTRDRQMLKLHELDSRYGFDRNKGYATPEHLDALTRFGHSSNHRLSFRPLSLSK